MMLQNRYSIIRQVGYGGSSKVYLAVNNRNNKQVIIKTFTQDNTSSSRVLNEVTSLTRLKYVPGIVDLFDIIPNENQTQLVLSYIPHGTLQNCAYRLLPESDLKKIAKYCLHLLKHCHDYGIVHNDLKPENLMFKRQNDIHSLHLIDFENALIDNNKSHFIRGTPHYMSPECLGYNCDNNSDIWSLGVMLFYLRSMTFPFDDWDSPSNPNMHRVWYSVFNDQPKYNPELFSVSFKDFLSRILVKNPQERANIEELLRHEWFKS